MGGEGKLNTKRRRMGSSAARSIQHSQDISWQAKQKTLGLIRPQRQGATDSNEQKRPSPSESLQTRSTRSTTAAYKVACRLLKKEKPTHALNSDWWQRKAVELQRAADSNNMKGFYNGLEGSVGKHKKGPVHLKSADGM